jgi:hypothetical protein
MLWVINYAMTRSKSDSCHNVDLLTYRGVAVQVHVVRRGLTLAVGTSWGRRSARKQQWVFLPPHVAGYWKRCH